jgi:hopanoid-associated phosphorylase
MHHRHSGRLGVITGLRSEARLVRAITRDRPPENCPLLFCAGGDGQRAFEGALDLVYKGATALVSFGVAGGLDTALSPGDLVLPRAVALPDGKQVVTDESWRRLAGRGLRASDGVLACSESPLGDPSEKRALRASTAAVAVDMESHGVAAAARAAGVPLLVVRAVLDTADEVVPSAALAGFGPDGGTRPLAVALGLLVAPTQLRDLLRLARASAAAHDALRHWLGRPGALEAPPSGSAPRLVAGLP